MEVCDKEDMEVCDKEDMEVCDKEDMEVCDKEDILHLIFSHLARNVLYLYATHEMFGS